MHGSKSSVDYCVGTVQLVNDTYREKLPSMVDEEDIRKPPSVEQ